MQCGTAPCAAVVTWGHRPLTEYFRLFCQETSIRRSHSSTTRAFQAQCICGNQQSNAKTSPGLFSSCYTTERHIEGAKTGFVFSHPRFRHALCWLLQSQQHEEEYESPKNRPSLPSRWDDSHLGRAQVPSFLCSRRIPRFSFCFPSGSDLAKTRWEIVARKITPRGFRSYTYIPPTESTRVP